MSSDPSTEWAHRLERRATDAWDQLLAVLLEAQQLLTALPGLAPQEFAAHLSQHWQDRGADAYQQLADGGLRYLARISTVAAGYGTQWLRAALPAHRLAEIGSPPTPPAVPAADGGVGHPAAARSHTGPNPVADPLQWTGWYVLYSAWSAQHQAWTGRAYQALRDEIAAGTMGQPELQASAQRFLQDRLSDYLGDIAEAGMDLAADGLSVGEDSVHTLATAVIGHPPRDQLTVTIDGAPGTEGSTELAIENNRGVAADIVCTARPATGWHLAVVPERFHLGAGQTRRVTIGAMLPDTATDEPVLAGRVTVSGHGDAPLTVRVRATTRVPQRHISVRALDPAPAVRDAPDDLG
jgi:hypothetical protein